MLDIGCADGALFRQLEHRIGEGVGVDPALVRSVGDGRFRLMAGYLPTDLTSIGQFDAITMLAVVEHLPDEALTKLRNQCMAVLKPGGVVLITVPSVQVDRILHWLTKTRLVAGMSLHEHHGFDPSSVPSWFSGNSLMLAAARRFQLGLNNLFVFRKGASAGASAETAASVPVATRG